MEDSLAGHNVTTVVQPDPRGAGAKMIAMRVTQGSLRHGLLYSLRPAAPDVR